MVVLNLVLFLKIKFCQPTFPIAGITKIMFINSTLEFSPRFSIIMIILIILPFNLLTIYYGFKV